MCSFSFILFIVKRKFSLQVLQVAVISPPYEASSIQCTNEVVLDKVIKLVQQMPVSTSSCSKEYS